MELNNTQYNKMETQMKRMEVKPSHLLFAGINDADLVRSFLQGKIEQREAEMKALEKYAGLTIVQTKFWGRVR